MAHGLKSISHGSCDSISNGSWWQSHDAAPQDSGLPPCLRSGGWGTKGPGDYPAWGRRTLHSQHVALLSELPQTALLGHALCVKTFQTGYIFIILTSQIKAKLLSFRDQPMPWSSVLDLDSYTGQGCSHPECFTLAFWLKCVSVHIKHVSYGTCCHSLQQYHASIHAHLWLLNLDSAGFAIHWNKTTKSKYCMWHQNLSFSGQIGWVQ